LTFEHLKHDIRKNVAHRQPPRCRHHELVRDGPPFPIPTQLKGRQIVYGEVRIVPGSLREVLARQLLKPYVERGGGEVNCIPSFVGNVTADSNTIEDEMTTIRLSVPLA